MKVCYCDESGTGSEPVAVMVGIVVDSQRMHVTKEHWADLLEILSKIVGRKVNEIHTRDFYSGNGVWRKLDGEQRSAVITTIFQWLVERKHHVVYVAVDKKVYYENLNGNSIPAEVNTLWKFMGFHLMLSVQRAFQSHEKRKGNTIFIFDNEEKEEKRFINLINNPPVWSDSYYCREKNSPQLTQIIDVPYFGDSKEVDLIQVADFMAYFLRRYAEIKEGYSTPYPGEIGKITDWISQFKKRSIGSSNIYPAKGRCNCAELFFVNAPKSIRSL